MLTLISIIFTKFNFTDMKTCYRVFRRAIIQSIDYRERAKPGCRVYDVGASYHWRTYEPGKKIGLTGRFRALWCILKYDLRR